MREDGVKVLLKNGPLHSIVDESKEETGSIQCAGSYIKRMIYQEYKRKCRL